MIAGALKLTNLVSQRPCILSFVFSLVTGPTQQGEIVLLIQRLMLEECNYNPASLVVPIARRVTYVSSILVLTASIRRWALGDEISQDLRGKSRLSS